MSHQQQAHDSLSGCLLRLFWLLGGNAVLAIVGVQILFNAPPMFSRVDAVYWSVVVLIIAARYADMRYFKGATAGGKPSSFDDWRRHTLILVVSAGVAWFAARLAVHFLGPIGPST